MEFFTLFMALSFWWIIPLSFLLFVSVVGAFIETGWCTLSFILFFGMMFFAIPELLTMIVVNPMSLITIIGCYIIIGIAWSFFRWFTFLTKLKRNGRINAPSASNYKNDIVFWIAYWPFSVLSYMLGDLVHDLISFIFNRLGKTYQMMSDYVFSDVMDKK